MSNKILLGEAAAYAKSYDPNLLVPIARTEARQQLESSALLSKMQGKDLWHSYELSWLNLKGQPKVAQGVFEFDCHSPAIIESKSFKYYLNSFNQTPLKSEQALIDRLTADLSGACGSPVNVELQPVGRRLQIEPIEGQCIDDLEGDDFRYTPDKQLLRVNSPPVENRCLYSHLLKSNCPVTGQPDWATLWIQYSGKEIVPLSLLRYVVSYRDHQDFHENCVERVYCDLMTVCQPEKLSVYACYTRRGGLDINPFRSNHAFEPLKGVRIDRQ